MKSEIYMLSSDDLDPPVHLFRINPLAISGIYFGCNADHEKALGEINSNTSLTHLDNIFKMEVNRFQYQLSASKIKRNHKQT